MNPAPAIKDLPKELLNLTDVITPNETESALLTGITISGDADLEKNAVKLHELGLKYVIITYGSKGAYVSSPVFTGLVPAFKVKAVDTTAAGDTFLGFWPGAWLATWATSMMRPFCLPGEFFGCAKIGRSTIHSRPGSGGSSLEGRLDDVNCTFNLKCRQPEPG